MEDAGCGEGSIARAEALYAAGDKDNPYISQVMADSLGGQGIMSWVYGLHLLNNAIPCPTATADEAVETLLSLRLADGGINCRVTDEPEGEVDKNGK
jgi:hypothetical protein